MALSRLPRCPACGVGVAIRLVWDMAPKDRFGLLEEPTGLVCPSCGTRLRIGQARSVVVLVAAPFVIIALTYIGDQLLLLGETARVVGAVAFLALGVFRSHVARHFATLRVRQGISTVDFPVERLRAQMLSPQTQDVGGAESTDQRVCRYCGESNPSPTSVCFHCGRYDANAI